MSKQVVSVAIFTGSPEARNYALPSDLTHGTIYRVGKTQNIGWDVLVDKESVTARIASIDAVKKVTIAPNAVTVYVHNPADWPAVGCAIMDVLLELAHWSNAKVNLSYIGSTEGTDD
jgi:hypothetical protein